MVPLVVFIWKDWFYWSIFFTLNQSHRMLLISLYYDNMNTEPGKRKTFLLKSVDFMCHKILELYLRFWDHECCRQSMYLSFPKQWKLKKKLIKIQFSRVASLYIRADIVDFFCWIAIDVFAYLLVFFAVPVSVRIGAIDTNRSNWRSRLEYIKLN